MTTASAGPARGFWSLTLVAAGLLMVTMGARQSLGLFVGPLNAATGLGVATISLALAIGQFVWGAVQPVAGALADRHGPGWVLAGGVLLLALGSALTPLAGSAGGLVLTLGLLSAAGSGAGSFSVLIGAAARHLPVEKRGFASGIVNAGGSFGQFLFAPLMQGLIAAAGWAGAMLALAGLTLGALPLAWLLGRGGHGAPVHVGPEDRGLWAAVVEALNDPSYLLLHAGFFTCGFHIAFLATHLPGEVKLCGLPPQVASWSLGLIGLANIGGSLFAGWCVQRFRSKYVLGWMYGLRAALILAFLAGPRSALAFYAFAMAMGFTWLATVPPTAGIVGKLFGVRYLATLFGLTLLTHQVGAFFGAWLGGVALSRLGSYQWMWYADAALAGLAALVNLPIREGAVLARPRPAAS